MTSLKTNVWPLLHGILWVLTFAAMASVFVLAQGCYKAWGAPVLHPAPPRDNAVDVELRRFPPVEAVSYWRERQQKYLDRLYFMAENGWGVKTDIDAAIIDQTHRYKCWDKLDDVQRVWVGNLEWRLERMSDLRHMIGDVDFYAGRMPDPLGSFNPE